MGSLANQAEDRARAGELAVELVAEILRVFEQTREELGHLA